MTSAINPNLVDTGTPPIPEARGWIARYDGARGPVIDLSQAAPAVAPPPEMLRRLADAAADPEVAKYGPIEGERALREAYARDVAEIYGAFDIGVDRIAITAGCNQAFMVTAMALAGAGDSIVLPSPWYFNHKMALDMLGVRTRPLVCHAQGGFIPEVRAAEELIDSTTRAIVLVTPNNPTGAVYSPQAIADFAELCAARDIWLIIDETYRDFLPGGVGRPHNLFARDLANVIQLYSFSKSYAIPGYRLGAILGTPDLMRQIAKALDTLQICPARIGQIAAAWGVEGLRGWRELNRSDINARADAFAAAMRRAQGWSVDSIGAYFAFVRHPYVSEQSARVAERLASHAGVLALPGSWFGPGGEQHLRVAFANAPMEMLHKIPERILG